MAHKLNTIVTKSKGHHDEGPAGGAIYPGEAVRLQAAGTYLVESLAAAAALGAGLKVAKESGLPGSTYLTGGTQQGTVDAPYASGDVLFFYIPLPGDNINALVKAGENIAVGDYLAVEGSGSGKFVELSSAQSAPYPIALERLRESTAMAVNLPGTASGANMGLITGTPGTTAPVIQGTDFGGTTDATKSAFEFILPPDYRAGSPITLRANAGMKTSIADTTATLTVTAYKDAGDGTVGTNLGPAAQSINSLTFANKDFVITPTGLVAGDRLIIILAFTGTDAANAAVLIPQINTIKVLLGNAVGGQLEALESSGGVLGSATLVLCRVLRT